jgi:hypothetical protein
LGADVKNGTQRKNTHMIAAMDITGETQEASGQYATRLTNQFSQFPYPLHTVHMMTFRHNQLHSARFIEFWSLLVELLD